MFLFSCDSHSECSDVIQRKEYIERLTRDVVEIPKQKKQPLPNYPWQNKCVGRYPKITKEHFRCKGKSKNPDKWVEQSGTKIQIQDCCGIDQHSLPIREQKEFIYPILIDLLNDLQKKLEKQVIVTSGHRCPAHHRYNDPSPKKQHSKHLIGAEVAFYVKGMEDQPEKIILLLQQYYQENDIYCGQSEYLEFKRWDKGGTDVSTLPWFNKEIFIKLYKANEGRDADNSHPYPYVSIQVRYDRENKQGVFFSYDKVKLLY